MAAQARPAPDGLEDVDWARLRRALARTSMIAYIRRIAPWFTIEEVHCVMAAHFEALMDGDIDRLMTFLPPRTGKSMMGSVFLPSMWTGRYPSDKILQVGHSVDLSRKFSLDVRELMRLSEYKWIFPGVSLAKDAQAAGKWRVEDSYSAMALLEGETGQASQRGEYNAAGVTSSIAGKGYNLGILDDAMSEQDKDSKVTKDRLWNWYGPGFYTRRQPERNAIALMATRWSTDDLPGRLIDLMNQRKDGADVWTILNVPAILDRDTAKKVYQIAKEYGQIEDLQELTEGGSFAPRRWTKKELKRSEANMTAKDWQALYMGNPQVDEGHILKRKYWRLWPKEKPPECVFIFQMYDTAFDEKTSSDFSARTTWGVFEHKAREGERASMNMVLLDRWKERVEAPDLKKHVMIGCWGGKETKRALLEMNPTDPDAVLDINEKAIGLNPDRILIENKASGIWLIKELRKIKKPKPMPIWPWNGPRGGRGAEMSKLARAYMGSLVMEQGAVWYMNRAWAEEVIEECAKCKFDGTDESDDLPDTVTASLIYVRQTYRVELGSDIDEEEEKRAGKKQKKRIFYGARQE